MKKLLKTLAVSTLLICATSVFASNPFLTVINNIDSASNASTNGYWGNQIPPHSRAKFLWATIDQSCQLPMASKGTLAHTCVLNISAIKPNSAPLIGKVVVNTQTNVVISAVSTNPFYRLTKSSDQRIIVSQNT